MTHASDRRYKVALIVMEIGPLGEPSETTKVGVQIVGRIHRDDAPDTLRQRALASLISITKNANLVQIAEDFAAQVQEK